MKDDRILREVGHRLSSAQLESLPKVLEYLYSINEFDLYFDLEGFGCEGIAGDLKIVTQDNPQQLKIVIITNKGKATVSLFDRKKNKLIEKHEI